MRYFSGSKILYFTIIGICIASVAYQVTRNNHSSSQNPEPGSACTLEAKLCPDGSSVGRVAPNCDFAPCPPVRPETSIPSDWKTYADNTATFRYPEKLDTHYIEAVGWPPKISLQNTPVSCTEAGDLSQPGGKTAAKVINSHTYCVTERREGAAGSIYSLFAYAFPENNTTAILTFSWRSPQCGNYPEPEQQACQTEEQNFSSDIFIDEIAQTVKIQ